LAVGLIALLDDVAAIAKVAAASLDDVVGQATKAGAKAAGVVIDDAAVTPRYMTGFAAVREIPIVRKIAIGSLRNKLLILLPAALALSYFLPSAITPLLMIGGAYLCYEGTEKVYEALVPHKALEHEAVLGSVAIDPKTLEDEKVAGAIKTDFILSAEIMAIALSVLPASNVWMQAVVLAIVAVGITAAVYGAVALIVKADDLGVMLAANRSDSVLGGVSRGLGRGLVYGMPYFLRLLSIVGTAAMIWVGGGIIVHGMETYGFTAIGHGIQHVAGLTAHAAPFAQGAVEWIIGAAGAGLAGLVVGAALIPLAGYVIAPGWKMLKGMIRSVRAA
jgi:predicted DNA repair protein MutK